MLLDFTENLACGPSEDSFHFGAWCPANRHLEQEQSLVGVPDLALGRLLCTLGPRVQRDIEFDTACTDAALVTYLSDEVLHSLGNSFSVI